ncbi:D-alanyl-D-alanine carboxypeptidase [Minicystis rosea]|nr:D-alanyl-D-alanine carboxypeptidase [Minicystis rosea]
MDVVSVCPLRVGSVLWKTATGALTLTVVAKATYELRPAESPLAPEQDEPTEHDEYWDDDERRSLHAPSDVAPFKRRADVILVGHAFAPGKQPVRSLVARILVGEVDKSIEVFAERAFSLDGQLREGSRFTKMPLRWERAAGGPDTANPVGVRAEGPRDVYGMLALPNLQPAGKHVTTVDDFIEPIGFGPIAPSWPPRQAKLHQSLVGWDFRRWNARPLPPDLDPGFFNAAPNDQQLDVIRPNERIVLENLHPEHARLVTNLASATPRAQVEWSGAAAEELGMRCDTLLIDTDRGTCTLTWRVQIPMDDPRRMGRVVVTTGRSGGRPDETGRRSRVPVMTMDGPVTKAPELPFVKGGSRPNWPAVPTIPQAVDRTMDAPLGDAMPALPFRVGRSPLAGTILGQKPPAPVAIEAKAQGPRPAPTLTDTQNDEQTGLARSPALPFASSNAASARATDDDEETHTELPADMVLPPWDAAAPVAVTPFVPAAKPFVPPATPFVAPPPPIVPPAAPVFMAPPPAPAPMPIAPAPSAPVFMAPAPVPIAPAPSAPSFMAPATPPPVPAPAPSVAPSFMASATPPPAPAPVPIVPASAPVALGGMALGGMGAVPIAPPTSATPWRALDADARPPAPPLPATTAPAVPEPARVEPPAPPPMIGPLATPEMVAPAAPEGEAGAPGETAPASPEEEATPPLPKEPELPLEHFTLERCAAIAASIARTKKEIDRILEEQDLAPDVWQKLDRHWTEHVRAQAGRGRTTPLKDYDAAYVAQLEKERGPIRVEEYARLVVAMERGAADEALAALSLPRGALLRLQRVWLARTSTDPELGKATRNAIDAAREA